MSGSFSFKLSPVKGEFFHSKFTQKYPIFRPETGAKIRVVNNTCICFHSLVTGKNSPRCCCGCRTFCDTSYSFKCSHSSEIQSIRHLMLVSDVTDSFEVLAQLCDMLRKELAGE